MTLFERPPQSESGLRRDLESLGVEEGTTLTVHASMSALGWVIGGAPSVVRALLAAVGESGTLAMPAATPLCADPAHWPGPTVPAAWLTDVRESLPVFDPATTPTTMGAIAETFRTWPGTRRSDHPLESVCARGPLAGQITAEHPRAFSEGPGSPFAKLYECDSRVLLLGVGFNRCTALHHAESLVERHRTMRIRFPAIEQGERVWVEVPNVADDNDLHFPVIGERFTATGQVRTGSIGEASCTLFRMRELVDCAQRYFDEVLQ